MDPKNRPRPSLISFFVRPREPFLRPDLPCPLTPRADGVKTGRHSSRAANRAVDRPRLDGGEHGVILRKGRDPNAEALPLSTSFNGCYNSS